MAIPARPRTPPAGADHEGVLPHLHGGLLKQRNKPSTQRGYQGVIDRCIIPIMGRMKVQDVKRPDVAALMKKLAYKQAEANRTFGVLRKMFNRPKWGAAP